MLKSLYVFLILAFVGITFHAAPAFAKCGKDQSCTSSKQRNLTSKHNSSKNLFQVRNYNNKKYAKTQKGHRKYAKLHKSKRKYARVSKLNRVSAASRNRVVAIIKSMAPRYGVPTWFALRIAKVESGYNPRAHGGAGEIGVFQLKCATAKGIGFRGSCKNLYDASTNVQFGLKHLSLAIKSSRGNLKLAASKHNGGLGRKKLVKKYVRMVF